MYVCMYNHAICSTDTMKWGGEGWGSIVIQFKLCGLFVVQAN